MPRHALIRLAVPVLLLTTVWIARTQMQGPPPPVIEPDKLTINKIKEDLYVIVGDGGNAAVFVTNEGVILIDDKYDEDHDAILGRIKSVTNQPLKYVINTHYHADHSGGNKKMLPVAEVISTENSRQNILAHRQTNEPPGGSAPARVTFTTETAIYLGGNEVRAHYFGRGHTNGDAMVYFPALKVLHTGDLMANASPLIDYNAGGSIIEWTKTLDAAMTAWDFDTVIPGHGAVTNKAGLIVYRDNVTKLRNRVSGLIREGKTEAEVAKVMETEYSWAPNSLQRIWAVPGMMKELR
jgi:glyoxylase-like metal-dependent hydrolase (beta-lactamase superfamily II)